MFKPSKFKNRLKDATWDRLSNRQKEFARRISRIIFSLFPYSHSLNMLALKHGTDKWSHGYIELYERYFGPIRRQQLNILEIGVGGHEDPKAGGHL